MRFRKSQQVDANSNYIALLDKELSAVRERLNSIQAELDNALRVVEQQNNLMFKFFNDIVGSMRNNHDEILTKLDELKQ